MNFRVPAEAAVLQFAAIAKGILTLPSALASMSEHANYVAWCSDSWPHPEKGSEPRPEGYGQAALTMLNEVPDG